jgi:hypothetical protein
MNSLRGVPDDVDGPRTRVDLGDSVPESAQIDRDSDATLQSTHDEVAAAIAAARQSENPRRGAGTESGQEPPAP